MSDITLTIQPPRERAVGGSSFTQTIALGEARKPLGLARWHCASIEDGVAQILELNVAMEHRRQGHGGRLLRSSTEKIREFFVARRVKPRRLWIAVEQKGQVIARAFLTQHGFHHVATVPNLLDDQDLLIYSRAFD